MHRVGMNDLLATTRRLNEHVRAEQQRAELQRANADAIRRTQEQLQRQFAALPALNHNAAALRNFRLPPTPNYANRLAPLRTPYTPALRNFPPPETPNVDLFDQWYDPVQAREMRATLAAIEAAAETARVTAANQYANQAATIPDRDRTTAFYAHYNAKSEEERQALLNNIQVARINATAAAQAERERVQAANRYADQMALNGQDRTTAFYAYYNRETELQRVATANQYADQVVATIPGRDRTAAFYAHYHANSIQERKMLEDALSVSVATARMESDCVATANQEADVAARNGADRTTSFFTHYTSVKERERVKSANQYADYALSMGQDRTGSFYTHYNAKSAEERQALEDKVGISRRNVVNAF